MNQLLTLKDLRTRTQLSRSTLLRMIDSGRIRSCKFFNGKMKKRAPVRVSEQALNDFIAECEGTREITSHK
jgi:predicted site-specific integrase-resolvase